MEVITTFKNKTGEKSTRWTFRMTPMRWVFMAIAAAAIAVIIVRFIAGLGATTNL
ncbi:MAG: hydrogenase, partial [Desulfitobacterium hafniense]